MIYRVLGWITVLALFGMGPVASAEMVTDKSAVGMAGLAMHQETGRNIYLGALHLDKQQAPSSNPVTMNGPRIMEYRVVARRTSMRSILGNILLQGELATSKPPSADTQSLAADIMASAQTGLYDGDIFELELSKEGETIARLNGTELASAEGRQAADYFLMGWIGQGGASTSFRNAITSEDIDANLLAAYRATSVSEERIEQVRGWVEQEEAEQIAEVVPSEQTTTKEKIAPDEEAKVEQIAVSEPEIIPAAEEYTSPEEELKEIQVAGVAIPRSTNMSSIQDPVLPAAPEPRAISEADITESAGATLSNEDTVQVALAAPAAVLAPEIPDGIDALGVVEYSQRLAVFNTMVLRRVYANIRYPRAAVRRNLQGTLELDLTVSDAGKLLAVNVIKPSGHNSLDTAAVSAAEKALKTPLADIDPVARAEYTDDNGNMVIPLPVSFVLTE